VGPWYECHYPEPAKHALTCPTRRYKTNIYAVQPSFMPGSAGQQGTDINAGLPYMNIVHDYVNNAAVVVHEFGHCMHYSEKNWVDQIRYVGPASLKVPDIDTVAKEPEHGGNRSQTSSRTCTWQRPLATKLNQLLGYLRTATRISIYKRSLAIATRFSSMAWVVRPTTTSLGLFSPTLRIILMITAGWAKMLSWT
jgi:hypothetical protein